VINKKFIFILLLILFIAVGGVLAQVYSGRGSPFTGGRGGRGGQRFSDPGLNRGRSQIPNQQLRTARGGQSLFEWNIDPEFPQDVFTFVRVEYNSSGYSMMGGGRGGRGGGFGGRWMTDYPDSDNNFSYRLHQVTSIQVNPVPVSMTIENPELFNYPFLYIVEPGGMYLSDNEVKILRQYLLNGGFLMLDDFWGRDEWYIVYTQMKKVFPDREPMPLTLDHPIFHCVFELKEMPQIPAYNFALQDNETLSGITTERTDAPRAIYYGIYDDKGRMMVIIDRDTDLGDGWEREGVSKAYFSEFSEKKAYPLGINIVFYAMTH
jgi:hypothetical protein